MNSFRRVVKSGVHQALDFGDGRECGAVVAIAVVSMVRAEENRWSSWLGEAGEGGGGISQCFSLPTSQAPRVPLYRGSALNPNPASRMHSRHTTPDC